MTSTAPLQVKRCPGPQTKHAPHYWRSDEGWLRWCHGAPALTTGKSG